MNINMSKYIDAEKFIKKFEKMIDDIPASVDSSAGYVIDEVYKIFDSLQQEAENERIKEQKELNKIAIQYRDDVIAHIEEKRVLPSFKGQLLHDFKNELNTMKQILNIQMWPQTQYAIFEKVALAFATWGGYHFHPKESLPEDELQQEQPEVDLEKFTEKIKTFQGRYKHPEIVSIKGAMAFMARMFYQYPNIARLWYEQLPKATMDNARKEG